MKFVNADGKIWSFSDDLERIKKDYKSYILLGVHVKHTPGSCWHCETECVPYNILDCDADTSIMGIYHNEYHQR